MRKNKYGYLDYIRFIAVFLVLYGHLITVGTYNTTLQEAFSVISEKNLPLIPIGSHHLYLFELFFNSVFKSQTAVIGVILFFLLTGYLTALTRYKYSAKKFIINKLLRLFPVLIFTTICSGMLLFLTQGIIYNLHNYIGTMTLSYPFLQIAPTLGVLWTLIVELIFYIIVAHCNNLNWKFIIVFDLSVIILIIFNKSLNSINLNALIYYLKYISIILIGVAIYYSESLYSKAKKCLIVFSSIILSYIILNLNKSWAGDETTYTNLGTYFTALSIFFAFYLINLYRHNIFSFVPKFIYIINSISYPIYLIQIPIGFTIMYWTKLKLTNNSYIIVLIGLISILVIAFGIHKLIEEPIHTFGKKVLKL